MQYACEFRALNTFIKTDGNEYDKLRSYSEWNVLNVFKRIGKKTPSKN